MDDALMGPCLAVVLLSTDLCKTLRNEEAGDAYTVREHPTQPMPAVALVSHLRR